MKMYFFNPLSVFFLAALCISFTSCGGSDDDHNSPKDETNTNIPSAIDTPKGYFDGQLYYIIRSYDTMEASVSEAESSVTKVTIPAYIKLDDKVYNVTAIGADAFKDCSSLTEVNIPNSVTSIRRNAFYGCSDLISVTVPNGVTAIGEQAFYECSSLTSITIPNGVTEIGDYAFKGCSSLTSIAIPNNVYEIAHSAFSGCSGLKSVTIGNSVNSIGGFAFSGCSNLTSITIPNSVTSIGNCAFQDCSSLTSVTIPNSVTSIEGYAFYGCSSLTSITIPNSVTAIGYNAFDNCLMSREEFINNSSLDAEANRYWGCDILDSRKDGFNIKNGVLLKYVGSESSIIIPNSVTSIGEKAFYGNSGLTSVTIPNSVTSIGYQAFNGCSNLTKIIINSNYIISKTYRADSNIENTFGPQVKDYIIGESVKSIGDYAFYNSNLTSVTIGRGITSIGKYAFTSCSSLKSITIPNSVTSIGSCAFLLCSNLKSITIPNSVIFIGSGAFEETAWYNNQNNGLIYVGKVAYEYKLNPVYFIDYLHLDLKEGTLGIARNAFHNEYIGLRSISIPNSVLFIGGGAFSRCTYLTDVYCYAKNVPTIEENEEYYVFPDMYEYKITLHVPAESIDKYKAKYPWKEFKNIVAL